MAYLHTKDNTYIYEIVSSEVIEATDVQVLGNQKGVDELTLITCTISGKNRVSVKANLGETIPK